jgi:hypothetical protein
MMEINRKKKIISRTTLKVLEALNQAVNLETHKLETQDTVEKFGEVLTKEQIEGRGFDASCRIK